MLFLFNENPVILATVLANQAPEKVWLKVETWMDQV